ncbi:hypothetical protein, partial [Acetobacter pasteurianus]
GKPHATPKRSSVNFQKGSEISTKNFVVAAPYFLIGNGALFPCSQFAVPCSPYTLSTHMPVLPMVSVMLILSRK